MDADRRVSVMLMLVVVLVGFARAVLMPFVLLYWFFRKDYRSIEYAALSEDQSWNTVLTGWPDETISARVWRESRWVWVCVIDWLFQDDSHCRRAYESERARKHMPSAYTRPWV